MKKDRGKSFLPPSNSPFKNLTRRDFVRASAILAGAGALSTFNGLPVLAKANMDELMEMFKNANIDWKLLMYRFVIMNKNIDITTMWTVPSFLPTTLRFLPFLAFTRTVSVFFTFYDRKYIDS